MSSWNLQDLNENLPKQNGMYLEILTHFEANFSLQLLLPLPIPPFLVVAAIHLAAAALLLPINLVLLLPLPLVASMLLPLVALVALVVLLLITSATRWALSVVLKMRPPATSVISLSTRPTLMRRSLAMVGLLLLPTTTLAMSVVMEQLPLQLPLRAMRVDLFLLLPLTLHGSLALLDTSGTRSTVMSVLSTLNLSRCCSVANMSASATRVLPSKFLLLVNPYQC